MCNVVHTDVIHYTHLLTYFQIFSSPFFKKKMPTAHSPNINLPPEIFIEICAFLPPADLFALSHVCRKFRGYLCAPNSFSTQQIWEKSRLQFTKNKPPPKGMDEKKYIELLMTEGCQTCK